MKEALHNAGAAGVCESQSIIDLFSGVGGLSLGAARAGFTIRGAIDNDPIANEDHKRNFPNTVHLETDISTLTGIDIVHELNLGKGRIAGIVGGPPCQGFSSIGRRNKDDSRNTAFVHFFRIVSEVEPTFFLVENVPGIMQRTYDRIREDAFTYVRGKYELLPAMVLSANDYGAPTNRKRVFFFGFLPDAIPTLTIDSFKPPSNADVVHVKDALEGLPVTINPSWQNEEQSWRIVDAYAGSSFGQRLHAHIPPGVGDQDALQRLSLRNEVSGFLGTAHTSEVARRYSETQRGNYDTISKSYRLDPDGYCPTLRAGTGPDQGSFQAVRPIHPTEARVITPREAARLQGFPDWFQFSPTKWHSFRQIGNSVSPILAETILSNVANSLSISKSTEDRNE